MLGIIVLNLQNLRMLTNTHVSSLATWLLNPTDAQTSLVYSWFLIDNMTSSLDTSQVFSGMASRNWRDPHLA